MNTKMINMANAREAEKWRGSVGGLVLAPITSVWDVVSKSSRLPEWMPMVETCTGLVGEEDCPGYVRLVSGFMYPPDNGDRSWIKERLLLMDSSSFTYTYTMEASNVGLDGSVNTLALVDYGDDSTAVEWVFQIDPVEGVREEDIIDHLGFMYKSCMNRIGSALN